MTQELSNTPGKKQVRREEPPEQGGSTSQRRGGREEGRDCSRCWVRNEEQQKKENLNPPTLIPSPPPPHVEWGGYRPRKGRDVCNEAKGYFPKCLSSSSSLFLNTVINNWKLLLISNKLNFVKFPDSRVLGFLFVQWQAYKLEIGTCDWSKADYF